MEADQVIAWADVVGSNPLLPYWIHHTSRADWIGTRPLRHTHDGFAELFWVESGRAIHEVDGEAHGLQAGDLVFVACTDVHRYRGYSTDFAYVNLAMPLDVVDDLLDRYTDATSSPWSRPPPRHTRLPAHDWARLLELGTALGRGEQSRRRVDHFMLELLMMLDEPVATDHPMPDWLIAAIARWRDDPIALQDGVRGLAAIAGRSREHVSRSIRRTTGRRAVDLINSLRIEHATAQLRMSDQSIARVAADCGLANLSHFYEVFRQHIGTTPRRYRLSHRRATNPVITNP